jgi:peptidoglycan/LPS O-acetylase OafA/YrhL
MNENASRVAAAIEDRVTPQTSPAAGARTLDGRGDMDSHAIGYRPDIDGLRAISVLAVVFYHLERGFVPGGYLGVDIFFVISGYLITSIIWREMASGDFTIRRFYDRRIRRILPALYAVLALVSVLSLIVLLPADLFGYGQSLLATLGFIANIYFWRDTNYFARIAEYKPLLHLWSLGIEEQFYIVFPPLLLLLGRVWRSGVLPIVALLVIVSYAADTEALRLGLSLPAFYLLPFRAWELGVGAALAILPETFRPAPALRTGLSVIGLAMIAAALFVAPEGAIDYAKSLAVLGASAMIVAGRGGLPIGNRLIATPPFVWFGLISYSLYLWHWPLIVFARYYLVRDLGALEGAVLVALAIALAWVSWRFVERPFRSRKITSRTVLIWAGAGLVVLAGFGGLMLAGHGFPGRLDARAAQYNASVGTNYRCPVQNYLFVGASRGCTVNLPTKQPDDADVALIGNSHVQMYEPAWEAILRQRHMTGVMLPVNACTPTVGTNIDSSCAPIVEDMIRGVLSLRRVKTVVLATTWTGELVDSAGRRIAPARRDEAFARGLDATIARLLAARKKVILIGPAPEPGYDIATVLSRKLAFGRSTAGDRMSASREEFDRQYGYVIQHFAHRGDIAFVRADSVQWRDGRYQFILDDHVLFADDNHLAMNEVWRYQDIFGRALDAASRP